MKNETIETLLASAKSFIELAEINLQKHNAGQKPGDEGNAVNFFSGGKVAETEYSYADIAKGHITQAQECLRQAVEL